MESIRLEKKIVTQESKLIKADQGKQTLKLFNAGSIIALVFIILTAGFMVFQNMKITEELSRTKVVATAFAEGIQTMCTNDVIRLDYERMCSIAEQYADEEHYLGEPHEELPSPTDIDKITCREGNTVIRYVDGSEAVADVECNTDAE